MSNQQGFPNVSSPIANAQNNYCITQPWLQFLISLWNRTGAAQGATTFSPGDIKASASSAAQDGWIALGSAPVSRTQYAALFQAIGTTWGTGDNVTTFGIPPTGAVLIGINGTFAIGTTGGDSTVTLTTGNLPTHTHPIIDPGHNHAVTDPGHVHTTNAAASNTTTGANAGGGTAGNTGSAMTGISIQNHTTGITTGDAGSSTAFSILPPYAAVQYFIKT